MSELMVNIKRGMIAGIPATMVLSALMLTVSTQSQFAHTSLINNLINHVLKYQGLETIALLGWVVHFLIGTVVWGGLFGVVEPILPGTTWRRKGLAFGIGCSFVLLVALIPIAAAGFFGMTLSFISILVTIIQHLVYGFVLGDAYWRLLPARERMVNPRFFSSR